MATNDKESSAAGTDNRPPMLEENDFESWKIRIEREKTDEEFTEAENNKEHADIQATNILGQELPRHIFNTLNQTETAKEIWENVELLMQGSGLTEQQKKKTLFDQYKRFQANGNELIHDYFVRFHKLINDMKITKMKILVHQRNTKFVNNLLSYWGKTSIHLMTQAMIQDGQITTESVQRKAPGHMEKECKEKKREKDSQWFKDKALLIEAKEKGAILDAEAEVFLEDVECTAPYAEPMAITTTTTFEVSHKDTYGSDVDKAPHAVAAFMANMMQTGPSTGQGTSNDTDFHSEVQTYDNYFFDNMNLRVSQEIHGGEQLNFDVDSVIDDHDNTIPYHQYQLNNEVESVPTNVSSVIPGEISMITILDDLRS
nr:hypothetical protein [Tanacetum cinerariifolium]